LKLYEKLLTSVNCKYNQNGSYFKNRKLNETDITLEQQIVIEIIVKPEWI